MKHYTKPLVVVTFLSLSLALALSSSCIKKTDKPKNIILLISDGCGYNQINAASIYQYGKTDVQVYEQFPIKYAMSTYSVYGGYDPSQAWKSFNYVKEKYTDSAASGTAIACGVKTYNGAIAVDTTRTTVETVLERAEKFGKATGVVTSVQFSHATPACFVIHDITRRNYSKIAKKMILDSGIDVIMGCGHPYYDNDGKLSADSIFIFVGGKETWQSLLSGTAGGDADGDSQPDPWKLIQDRVEFQNLMTGPTPERVIGIPKILSTLQQRRSSDVMAVPFKVPLIETVPTLAEMTTVALNVLDEDKDGFFLMVEGGAVDWACHGNQPGRLIEEEIDFNKSVEAVVEWVNNNSNWDETLVIVTGDHETGYLLGPDSGNVGHDSEAQSKAIWNPLINNGKGNLPGMEWHSRSHTNSLIPLFAKGIGSKRFTFYADEIDLQKGRFIDNSDIGKLIFSLYD